MLMKFIELIIEDINFCSIYHVPILSDYIRNFSSKIIIFIKVKLHFWRR